MLSLCLKALTEHDDHSDHDRRAVYHGLITLGGIYLFFVVERIVGLASACKRTQNERRMQVALHIPILPFSIGLAGRSYNSVSTINHSCYQQQQQRPFNGL